MHETRREREQAAIRADALQRYARTRGGAAPALCTPPPAIAAARTGAGLWDKKPKVIFNSIADAEAFAAIVYGLTGEVQNAYPCEYSRTGHAHLTSGDVTP